MHRQPANPLEELIKEAQNGNKEAFRAIFESLSNKFLAYAISRTGSREDALDIVQETFIDLWQALDKFQYRSKESFYGFVFAITKRKIFKYYQSRPKSLPLNAAWETENHKLPEDHQYLLKEINALREDYQDVLRLRYWADMGFEEIAFALNIKESTCKVWHHRALQKLKTNLDKQKYVF